MSSSQEEYSSDEESIYDSNESHKSKVLLGFADGPITEDDQPILEDTFIGGQPIWLHPESKPKEDYLICDRCGKKLALLLQAFSPLDGALYDRVLYIFGCKNGQCAKQKGSVKAIRGINKSDEVAKRIKEELDGIKVKEMEDKLKSEQSKKLNDELTKNLFNKDTSGNNPFGGSNPFAKNDNPFSSGSSNPFANAKEAKTTNASTKTPQSYAEVAKTAPKSPKRESQKLQGDLPQYNGSFVYVDSEKFRNDKDEDAQLAKYKHLIEENDAPEEGASSKRRGSSSSAVLDPQTTKISNMLDDKYFENFSSTVKHNPGQVLRYDLNGKPLLYNGKDDVAKAFLTSSGQPNIPRPGYNPSSERRFELQLMPKAIMDLEGLDRENVDIKDILNGMSWGTIIVCTDVEDYIREEDLDENKVGYVQEWCGVQWEESA
ncbi:hypothetical protein KGF57_000877 [Candida theae]|uniref:Programmed cell death protein 2 C-terminal domain-containing protein n=1 Tax=Candida theae TaxID=1198502 RepID=A0AAD5G0G8_9ASCO|nr:uncharacterized protein KGF57_000877 [Candida theae]KAI5965084.1 hypothetical protein KGF57_000877 [Candida theae]